MRRRPSPYHVAILKYRRHLITGALQAAGGNKVYAAKRLGIPRTMLYDILHSLDAWGFPVNTKGNHGRSKAQKAG